MDDPYSQILRLDFITLNSEPQTLVLISLLIFFLLFLSALFSGAEVAFFSLTPVQQKDLKNSSDKNDQRILELLVSPSEEEGSKQLLATVLIANNFVNVGIIIISAEFMESIFPMDALLPSVQFLIHVVLVTFIIVLFGEVIPKVYATNHNLKLARLMSLPLIVCKSLFKPLWRPLIYSTSFINQKLEKKSSVISVNELGHALELTNDEERSEEEQKILEGIVNFGNKDVKQIMTSRVDIVTFSVDDSFMNLVSELTSAGYSRIPIYKNSEDQIVGVLYAKDLLPHLNEDDFAWQDLLRAPFFVPENKKIDDLLREFQMKKIHVAIVVDEYGGTSGLVTLEDVIEEIVGDINDEFDLDEIHYSKLDDNNYVFEGKTALIDLYRILDIEGDVFEAAKGEADTLAGFVIEQTGKIAVKGERIVFRDYIFTVEAADRRRVKRIKVTINDKN